MKAQRHHGEREYGRHGPPLGWGGPGHGFPFGLGRPPFGTGRARRGDVRAAILGVLAEHPANGYQIMQELEQRSGGLWRPSPGSVYPTLEQLVDEGLIQPSESEGGRVYALTDAGREHLEKRGERVDDSWHAAAGFTKGQGVREIRDAVRELLIAALQVARNGSDAQRDSAREVLVNARRQLYRILAGDDVEVGG
jgi:DNA-binding PadR family transcriptional regulator